MFIELVDALRCPAPHEETWLVASATRMEARHIVEGMLGCPVCHAEYPVRRGVVDFRRARGAPRASGSPPPRDPREAMRLAAFLGLASAGGFAVLLDGWGAHAPALRELVETPLILVDPPSGVEGEPGVSVLLSDGPIPLATGAARGVAIQGSGPQRASDAVRITRAGGRLVGPADLALPSGVSALARDDTLWVGEKEPETSALVTLHVRRG
jgi:uncharacterized protein YbaR (Trm112 family)